MGFLRKLLDEIVGKVNKQTHTVSAGGVCELKVLPLEEVWKIEEHAKLVNELGLYTIKKCAFGDDLSILSEAELVFYITQTVETNVNSDGFQHVLFYTEDDCIEQIVPAFLTIGAVKTAEICKRALLAYGQPLPRDITERQNFIAEQDEAGNEEAGCLLNECDEALYRYEENLNELNYAYIMKNRTAFT